MSIFSIISTNLINKLINKIENDKTIFYYNLTLIICIFSFINCYSIIRFINLKILFIKIKKININFS